MAIGNGKARSATPAFVRNRPEALRILCTEITPYRQLIARAARDLGFDLAFESHDFVTAQRLAATEPERYDVYDQCFHNLDIVWYWRAIKPIEIERIVLWNEVSDLTKRGAINTAGSVGLGDAPVTRLYVKEDSSLSSTPSNRISMLPTVHNFDSFAVNEDAAGIDVDKEVHSWADLLSPRWKGHISIVDEPAIGFFDIALAARAAGKIKFRNAGNMSVEEIDQLIEFALNLKREGYFAPIWKTTREASRLMGSGVAVIGSMWSPSVVELKARRVRIRQAVPMEGYRGWHGGLCLARHLEGHKLDQAYAYLNWFLSGWPGAVAARQGYYISVSDRVRNYLDEDEWAYWYEGKMAPRALPNTDGAPAIRAGEVRSGGSYWNRASQVAIWNTTMDEHNYLVRRWQELTGGSHDRVSSISRRVG